MHISNILPAFVGQQKKFSEVQPDSESNPGDFNSGLTEAADALMSNGDVDVYVDRREDFEQAISLYSNPGMDSHNDSEDDMFGDTYEEKKPFLASQGNRDPERIDSNSQVETTESAMNFMADPHNQPATSASTNLAPKKEDFGHWPISELKRYLRERGEIIDTCVEKVELVERAVQAALKEHHGDVSCPPDGFEYDKSTGYYFSSESGMYYDASSGATYVPTVGKWYDTNWVEIR